MMVPFEVSIEGLVVGYVRNSTARLLHGIQSGFIQLSGLLQPQLPLHLLQSLVSGHDRLEAAALLCVQVSKPLQITLRDITDHIKEPMWRYHVKQNSK